MDKKGFVHIGYRHLDDAMRRIITVPSGFSFVMFDDIDLDDDDAGEGRVDPY